MAYSIETLETGGGREWDDFVLRHRDSTYCHLSGWRRVLEHTYRLPCSFIQLRDGKEIRGVFPLVHMKGPIAPNRLVSMPFLDQGGILTDFVEAGKLLVDFSTELATKVGARGLDLRGPMPGVTVQPENAPRVRFVTALPHSEEELWTQIGSKVRNQIRKSEKSGLYTKIVDTSRLSDFYKIFSTNMRDLGSPTHSLAFFRSLAGSLAARCHLYLTFSEDERPVAGGIAIIFRDTVTVPWASSLRLSRPDCPNHSLYWRILRDARQSGAKKFDFGRSSVGTGTYRFKKQWGAEPIPLAWRFIGLRQEPEGDYYLKPGRKSAMPALWRRLPLPVTVRLGPWIRKQLPN